MISKLPHVGTTIFTIMSGLANEHQAINLSQGFPNFPCDEKLLDLVTQAMKSGFNQYAPMAGVPILRERIAQKIEKLYGANFNPDTEITVTVGATEAVFDVISAIVHAGDEVIVIEPAYDSYLPAIALCGAKPVCVPLDFPSYAVNWQKVAEAITPKTKLLIYNTPHNPSGSNWKKEDLEMLEKIAEKHQFYILADEVYEHIAFTPHISILTSSKLRERSFAVYSFGKTFHATGWRVGYCVAPAHLTNEFRKVHQYVSFSIATPFQYAIAEYLKDENNYLHISEMYQQKRDKFCQLLAQTRFEFTPASGTYFQLASYKNMSDEHDRDFAIRMVKDFGVAAIPMSPFYQDRTDHKMIRFCFAKTDETLEMAAEKLIKM